MKLCSYYESMEIAYIYKFITDCMEIVYIKVGYVNEYNIIVYLVK